MKDGKFHPIKTYQKIRKARNSTIVDGVKIVNITKGKDVLNGITNSLKHQPKSVRKNLNIILIKDKDPEEDFVARADTTHGNIIFNKKPELGQDDYEALGDHEFEHIDFNAKLEQGDPKYEEFIKQGNTIRPFTPDLMATKFEQDSAFIEGNFGILPDKRLEYPDEINSVVKEIETRQRLGLPTRVLDEEEFRKAKMLVDNIHRKKRDIIGFSNKPDSFFNKKQLAIGTKIELEHTNNPKIAKRIAKDHLEESPRYYIELKKLEKKLMI